MFLSLIISQLPVTIVRPAAPPRCRHCCYWYCCLPAHTVVLHTQLQYRCRGRVSGGRAVGVSTRVTWMNNHSCMNDWTTLIEQPSTIAIEIDVYYRDNIVEGKQFNIHLRGLLANTNYINLTFGIKILNSKSILNQISWKILGFTGTLFIQKPCIKYWGLICSSGTSLIG